MTTTQKKTLWFVFGLAAALALELGRVSLASDQLERLLADKRKALHTGLVGQLGPAGVEAMLADLRARAAANANLRQLLSAHGYAVEAPRVP